MGWTFPWYSSYGSDFNYDFHATLDDRVAPVLLHVRTEAELAEAGTPWTGGPWTESMRGEEMPGISAFPRVGDEVFHTYSTYGRGIEDFHSGYPYLDLTALGRQEAWEEPKGRAAPARATGRWPRDAPARRIRHLTSGNEPAIGAAITGIGQAFSKVTNSLLGAGRW